MTDAEIRKQAIINLATSKAGLPVDEPPVFVSLDGEIMFWHNDDPSIRPSEAEIEQEILRLQNET